MTMDTSNIAPTTGCLLSDPFASPPDCYQRSGPASYWDIYDRKRGDGRKRRLSPEDEHTSDIRRRCPETGRVRFSWNGRKLVSHYARPATATKMHIEMLPAEIVSHIFLSLQDISSVAAFSSTCQYFHDVLHKQRLAIFAAAANAEFGPSDEIIQIITHNSIQPAHIRRSVPLSQALVQQIIKVGRVAQRWEATYPIKKWHHDYENRRLLTPNERYLVRRAIYRLWLFTKAFHNRTHIRTARNIPEVIAERALLLHKWSTPELAEMLDVHNILKQVVSNNVCPSNGNIRQQHAKRHPHSSDHQLLFNIHLNYPPPQPALHLASMGAVDLDFLTTAGGKYHASQSRGFEPGYEGWGDDISHYYIVEDMMKLDPEQILFLRDTCPRKAQVEAFVRATFGGGEWFVDNGETFSETLGVVVRQRGWAGELEGLRGCVEGGAMGVVVIE